MGVPVGIRGVGVALPETVRRNDWWPPEVVAAWRARLTATTGTARDPKEVIARMDVSQQSQAARRVFAAINRNLGDLFDGVTERRVRREDELLLDLGVAAARDALARAGVAGGEIDLVLAPDRLQTMSMPHLQRALGLSDRCLALPTAGGCTGLLHQLGIAVPFIASGAARFALLIQMGANLRALDPTQMLSVRFGEGASALILGPVGDGFGVLGQAYLTDGTSWGGIGVATANGKSQMVHHNPLAHARMFLELPAFAKTSLDAALGAARLSERDIGFWACHRAAPWMQSELAAYCGVEHAAQVNTYPWTGNMFAVNIPLSLALAEREGTLTDGMVVAMFAVSAGATFGAAVLRWGGA